MSEQNQSNFQALGAGLLGFVAVLAVGGGALMIHSSQQAKAAAKPMAAATSIDLGAAVPRFESMPSRPSTERRAESPAPLIGDEDQSESSEAADAPRAASTAPEGAASERARLKVDRHVEASGGSAIEASVKNSIAAGKAAEEKAVAKGKAVKKAALKLDPAAGANAVASVHYGVTSRSELMGRATGPVNNVKGNAAVARSGGRGRMAEDMSAKVDDLKGKLEAAGLSAEQRAALVKDLEAATGALDTAEPQ